MKRISVIIPVLNEKENILPLHAALARVVASLPHEAEFVFVDDGSTDGTSETLVELAARDARVRAVTLTRNFGKEIALTAGIHQCDVDACVLIDADLQHPPELIPEFIRQWEAGAEVVVGVRTRNHADGPIRRACSAVYYRVMSVLADVPLTPHATDFRLLDRVVIDEFRRFTEHGRLTRALIDWLGFRRAEVPFEAPVRASGRSRYGALRLMRLAFSSVIAHSLFPLKLAGYLGLVITFVSGLFGAFILVEQFLLGDPWNLHFSGTALLAIVILFLVGIILSCLGLIALYIGTIHGEVANRPLYVLRTPRR